MPIPNSEKKKPVVTIVTAAHNAAPFFGACIRSVLAQTHTAWRWIIVNDGSTDNTLEMAREIYKSDPRVHLINQEQKGVSAARNAAFSQVDRSSPESTSEFVLFLDADDELTPQALEKLVALAQSYPGAPAVCAAFSLIGERGEMLDWAATTNQILLRESGLLTEATLAHDNPLWNPAQVLIARTALEAVMDEGKVFDERFSIGEDWDLLRRLSKQGTIIAENFVAVLYRKHPGGVTSRRSAELPASVTSIAHKHRNERVTPTLVDPLHRVEIPFGQSSPGKQTLAVVTMASAGYDHLLDSMLGSLRAHGELPTGASVVVLNEGDDARCRTAINAHARRGLNVRSIPCRGLACPSPAYKAAMYAAAEIINADYYLCMDADTLVLGSLHPILESLKELPSHKILSARDSNGVFSWARLGPNPSILQYLSAVYQLWWPTFEAHWTKQGVPYDSIEYVCNDGVFGGSRQAMLQLAQTLRSWMPRERHFVNAQILRNQLMFNLALAKNDAFAELPDRFNAQVHASQDRLHEFEGGLLWHHKGEDVRPVVVHFTGHTKHFFAELQQSFRLKGS